ncbi:hypothetical protein EHS13_29975 [Paenibacillus psychroresistens]|uniref:TcaA protein NTF2-like domain-containing protein n=1 Tax=Paenibacillus psychroresistens TaxID=1778678 RepID=A0A6B8RTC1_9BACL|nr:hypothetical protein [Paenibacillus psychroresistens]QGQ98805.1 hypothetical protein EHS13_29975 [Paenibacillus psychroresistens]
MKFYLILLALMFILTSCSNNDPANNEKPSPSVVNGSSKNEIATNAPLDIDKLGGAKADDFFISELVANYENLLIQAINNNEFTAIENLLIVNSPLYNSQKKLVKDLYAKRVQEKMVDFSIEKIESLEKEGTYNVYVNERIAIKYPDKQDFETKEFNWIYKVVESDGKLGLSDIEKWVRETTPIEIGNGPIIYKNEKIGFKINIPKSWKDKYEVKETDDTAIIYYQPINKNIEKAILFEIDIWGTEAEWNDWWNNGGESQAVPFRKLGIVKGHIVTSTGPSEAIYQGRAEAKEDSEQYDKLLLDIKNILDSFRVLK